jgi:hypothetical protein
MMAANPTEYEVSLDVASREYGGLLGAVLTGVGRDFRLASTGPLASAVAEVEGSVIVTATAWTLLSALRDNVDTLYFAARDGEILPSVVRLLQQDWAWPPKLNACICTGAERPGICPRSASSWTWTRPGRCGGTRCGRRTLWSNPTYEEADLWEAPRSRARVGPTRSVGLSPLATWLASRFVV